MRDTVASIKERLDIAEVLGSYIKLEKAGRNFKARCPFHNEKTPSFMVSPERQSYYCFGCGEHGDMFTFVESQEGVDFKGALKILAERAGVEIEWQPGASKDEKEKLYAALEDATNFFQGNLQENPEVIKYLHSRGLIEKTIKEWRIGFAPDEWRSLLTELNKFGHTKPTLLQAGLIKNKEGGEPYDVFRNRVIFPLFDSLGRVVAFSGRALDRDNPAKYLNSPETLLFNKSEFLYGLHKAKEEIRRKNFAVLVEGQLDLLLSHQAGVGNTVASSGTAFTTIHLEKLKKFSPRIILAFDGDIAGEKAAEKSSVLALSLGMEVKVAQIPEGRDPADLVKEDPESWKEVLKSAKHTIEYELLKLEKGEKDRRKLGKLIEKKVLPLITLLTSSIEKSHFVSLISQRTGIKEEIIWDDLKKVVPPRPANEVAGQADKPVDAEDRLVITPEERIKNKLKEVNLWLEDLDKKSEEFEKLTEEKEELEIRLRVVELEEKRNELQDKLRLGDEKALKEFSALGRQLDEEKRKLL